MKAKYEGYQIVFDPIMETKVRCFVKDVVVIEVDNSKSKDTEEKNNGSYHGNIKT